MDNSLEKYDNESMFESIKSDMTIVTVDNCLKLNVREEPSLSGKIIAVLEKGDVLEKTNKIVNGSFSEVRIITGEYGYAMTKYLKE